MSDMESVKRVYLAKKGDYSFYVLRVEERKNVDSSYSIKIREFSGYVHNCGLVTPHIVQRNDTCEDVTQEMLLSYYDELKGYGYRLISKENYDKVVELYDNYHKVFVETGRKIKKLIKKHRL